LTIGELWAVPTMLRLALIENLRRLAQQILEVWSHQQRAEASAAALIESNGENQPPFEQSKLADHFRPDAILADPFVVDLFRALRQLGPRAIGGIEWLERHLHHRRTNSTEIFRREHRRQASNQVSVGNCVTSLRLLSALDWTVFFERTSLVEAVLRDD